MADRWFLVPLATDAQGRTVPKYRDTSGLNNRWSGNLVTINGTQYYAVRYYGTTSGLDKVEQHDDATSIQESGLTKDEIASYLNDKTGHSYSFSEWEQRFLSK